MKTIVVLLASLAATPALAGIDIPADCQTYFPHQKIQCACALANGGFIRPYMGQMWVYAGQKNNLATATAVQACVNANAH